MKLKAVLLSAALTVFAALTFTGAGYVLYNGGRVSAGYAVIPFLFFCRRFACLQKATG